MIIFNTVKYVINKIGKVIFNINRLNSVQNKLTTLEITLDARYLFSELSSKKEERQFYISDVFI